MKHLKGREPTNGKIVDDPLNRYWHFHVAAGSIDGTHIIVMLTPKWMQLLQINGVASINAFAADNFDLKFTYLIADWEGIANDTYTLRPFASKTYQPSL